MVLNCVRRAVPALLVAMLIAGCHDSGTTGLAGPNPGEPAMVNDVPQDAFNWINFTRARVGMGMLQGSAALESAADGHSGYLRTNNVFAHEQVQGKPGFTGASLIDRLRAAGYAMAGSNAYGEVLVAASSGSGFYLANECLTSVYRRFVLLEPRFTDAGCGAASTSSGYTYLTCDFAGLGFGIPSASVVNWPFAGQAAVPTDYFTDNDSPDPVPGANETGYPISVHANAGSTLEVTRFTLAARRGAPLATRLLTNALDSQTPTSAAAIIPLAPLRPATTYDVSFDGRLSGVPVTRSWSFTTR